MASPRRRGAILPVAALALAVLLPVAILLGTAWLFGWRFQPVETGSMEPAFPRGALAVVQPVEASKIVPGATVVFAHRSDPARLIAHRIVRALPGDPPRWETKGDANVAVDAVPISITDVRGIIGWAVPGLGHVVTTLRGAPALVLLVGLPLAVLAITEIGDRRRKGSPAATNRVSIDTTDR